MPVATGSILSSIWPGVDRYNGACTTDGFAFTIWVAVEGPLHPDADAVIAEAPY